MKILLVLLQVVLWSGTAAAFQGVRSTFSNPELSVISSQRECSFSDVGCEASSHDKETPHMIFPGGGIFFYWQAGVVTCLREKGYDLSSTTSTGASAGALTATLAAADVDFYRATELALDMAGKAGVWDRKNGLQGIWGPMIYDWLDELLPHNAVELAEQRGLSVLITRFPKFQKEVVGEFIDKEDLIRCNMASVHLPWFLNGRFTSRFRTRRYIDGSFLAKQRHYLKTQSTRTSSSFVIQFDHKQDPVYERTKALDFIAAMTPGAIWKMLEDGKRYANYLEEQGKLDCLQKKCEQNV